jgi:hypothetical protein
MSAAIANLRPPDDWLMGEGTGARSLPLLGEYE